jgi:hypothetical protein
MRSHEAHDISCPHCGAHTLFFVDPSAGHNQKLVEDCQVCCRPILFHVEIVAGEVSIQVEPTE